MLAYKIVLSVMFGTNIILLGAKAVQAAKYSQLRVTLINAIGQLVAVAMIVWTWSL